MNILQNIFNDHYEEHIYINHPRHSVIDNVDRMLGCGDPSFGAAMYGCTSCGNSDLQNCSIDYIKESYLQQSSGFSPA